ncbi:MAG: EAL domain-containing protein [Paraclostridium sp.]
MKKIINRLCFIAIVLFVVILSTNDVVAQHKKEVIKVGFYNYSPYYLVNEQGKPDGYYNDLLRLISNKIGVEYEYVHMDVNEAINKLKSGKVDLLFGINKTEERLKDLTYSDHYIAVEKYSVYTNQNIRYGDLENLNGSKFGYIENEANSEWIIKLLNNKEIDVDLVKTKSYQDTINLLLQNKIDATVATSKNTYLHEYNSIFEYSSGPVYIVSKKGNEDLINNIDMVFEEFAQSPRNPIKSLHDKYFNEEAEKVRKSLLISVILLIIIIIILIIIIYINISPKIKLKNRKKRIISDIENNNYTLHYQPIVNPKNNVIKGIEALLRKKENDKILTPYYFIKEIEESGMMFDMSLWIIKKVMSDYNIIKNYESFKHEDFYISVNVSFREIEDEIFVNNAIDIAKKMNMKPNSICLEIVEKFGMNNFDIIQKSISELKKHGFIVAIDDFGVEYSNLDILEKLDCNIVKLDKYFVDDIEESVIRKEIINFIAKICKLSGKTIVSEGVETPMQRDMIKEINNDKFYIQGYIYSKPIDIKELKEFKVD